jgi:hypothetical protein
MPVWKPVVKAMPVWKPVVTPAVVTPTVAAASAKAGVVANAAATSQGITQTQSVGAVTGNNNTINFATQTAHNNATTTTTINTAIAWGTNSTAGNGAVT